MESARMPDGKSDFEHAADAAPIPVLYANADILADFGAVPTSLTVAVHQLSAVAGRGFARTVTLPIS